MSQNETDDLIHEQHVIFFSFRVCGNQISFSCTERFGIFLDSWHYLFVSHQLSAEVMVEDSIVLQCARVCNRHSIYMVSTKYYYLIYKWNDLLLDIVFSNNE